MAERTNIEWAHATWNPWMGCHKFSLGCKNCYMYRDMPFRGRDPHRVVRASDATFFSPLKWGRTGKLADGNRIFPCSWSDWNIEEADQWRPAAWEVIRQTPQFNYLILTKRVARYEECLPVDWHDGWGNVWVGFSAETQMTFDYRVQFIRQIPAAIKMISIEPMLGPIDISRFLEPHQVVARRVIGDRVYINRDTIDYAREGRLWVITGGESDRSEPRPLNIDWVRSVRDQCVANGVPFFHKQHGGKTKVNGSWGGHELDGTLWNQIPFERNIRCLN